MKKNIVTTKANKPYFSIVIPVYNRVEVIGKALDSCLKQTYQDFEIIVVDDGSTDALKTRVDNFSDERIHYIHQENSGGSVARNTGICAARGEYIAFLDSDDFFLEDKLLKCYRILKSNDCDCLYSQVYLDRGVGKFWVKPPRAITPDEHMANYLLRDRGWIPTSTLVIKRDLADKVRYRETLVSGDDTDFSIRLYNAGAIFKMVDEPLVICSDFDDPGRVSLARNYFKQLKWTEELKQIAPSKAYYGYRGWHLAKMRTESSYGKAFLLYLDALWQGAYSPKLALLIFFQIFLPKFLYRGIANLIAAMMGVVTVGFGGEKIER